MMTATMMRDPDWLDERARQARRRHERDVFWGAVVDLIDAHDERGAWWCGTIADECCDALHDAARLARLRLWVAGMTGAINALPSRERRDAEWWPLLFNWASLTHWSCGLDPQWAGVTTHVDLSQARWDWSKVWAHAGWIHRMHVSGEARWVSPVLRTKGAPGYPTGSRVEIGMRPNGAAFVRLENSYPSTPLLVGLPRLPDDPCVELT